MKKVLLATNACPISEDVDMSGLQEAARNILNDPRTEVALTVGGTTYSTDFAQFCTDTNCIHLQGGWFAEMEHMDDVVNKLDDKVHDLNHLKHVLKWHFTLATIKVIHEFVHSMTSSIMAYEFKIRRARFDALAFASSTDANVAPPQQLKVTPLKIGTIRKVNNQFSGNMGFAMEEILSGGVRFNAKFVKDGYPWELMRVEGHQCIETVCSDGTTQTTFSKIDVDFQCVVDKVADLAHEACVNDFIVAPITAGTPKQPAAKKAKSVLSAGTLFPSDKDEEENDEDDIATFFRHGYKSSRK